MRMTKEERSMAKVIAILNKGEDARKARLAEAEASRKAYHEEPVRFTVKGRGVFPADMLRHDRCYPVDGEINMVTDPLLTQRPLVEVVLVAPNRSCVTPRRWASFGWIVTDIAGEDLL